MVAILKRTQANAPVKQKISRLIQPTGVERFMNSDEIIVSKTDIKGQITYVNDVFLKIADYTERDMLGAPHSVIRHPDMPRAIFKLMWDTLAAPSEIFAYVVNMAANGDHYWVLAHVTPSYDSTGRVIGYHSNRRAPNQKIIKDVIKPLYANLLSEEAKHTNRKSALDSSYSFLLNVLKQKGLRYDEFIFSLEN